MEVLPAPLLRQNDNDNVLRNLYEFTGGHKITPPYTIPLQKSMPKRNTTEAKRGTGTGRLVFPTFSARQTQLLGVALAKEFLRAPLGKKAAVIALTGELGSGKTTFVQGFAKGLGVKEKILSPTFVILKEFYVSSFRFHAFYHIDCYRIKDEQDLVSFGWDKTVSDPRNLVFIEWPERIQKILPKETISISLETTKTSKPHERKITFFFGAV